MKRLRLAGLEDDQPCPGVSDVSAVPPAQRVLLARHLQAQGSPADPRLSWTNISQYFHLLFFLDS